MPRRVSNPPNPWTGPEVEWLEEPPEVALEVYEERAKSILSRNDSPDIPFTWSVNPYRGCQHGCAYCYARATHPYLGFGAGTDFESRVVAKVNAPALLARALDRPSWSGEPIAFSGNTDCYQPLEASYRLTRRCLEVCLEREQPVLLITRSALVRRDLDLLVALARGPGLEVTVSIPILDAALCRALEPHAPAPRKRLEVLRAMRDAGISPGVAVAPVIPGLTEAQVPEVLAAAAEAGATSAFTICLRLAGDVAPVFEERLRAARPDAADKVLSAVRDVRGGRTNEARFGARMRGAGPRWEVVEQLFRSACKRHGLATSREVLVPRPRRRPRQGELF